LGGWLGLGVGEVDGDSARTIPAIGEFELLVFESVIVKIASEGNVGFAVTPKFGKAFGVGSFPILDGVGAGIDFGGAESFMGNDVEADTVAEAFFDFIENVEMRKFGEREVGVGLEDGNVEANGVVANDAIGGLEKGPKLIKIWLPKTLHFALEFLEVVVELASVGGNDGDAQLGGIVGVDFVEETLGFNVEDNFGDHRKIILAKIGWEAQGLAGRIRNE